LAFALRASEKMVLPFDSLLLALSVLDPIGIITGVFAGIVGFIGLIVLVIIGILVIVLVVGALIVLLPAIIVAIVVWFFTGSFFLAGVAFLIVAIISLVAI
jgi:hypothetical protein